MTEIARSAADQALLIGSLPQSGIAVAIENPAGYRWDVTSGSKVEYGVGGFEMLVGHADTYRVSFLDQAFEVQINTREAVRVSFQAETAPPQAAPTLVIAPSPTPDTATPSPTPDTTTPVTPAQTGQIVVEIDPRMMGIIGVEQPAGSGWWLRKLRWLDEAESDGKHHIYLDLRDEQGRRAAGAVVKVSWMDGLVHVPIEEKPGEEFGGNFAMFNVLGSYSVWVDGTDATAVVRGLGMGTPKHPKLKIHTTFELTFQFVTAET